MSGPSGTFQQQGSSRRCRSVTEIRIDISNVQSKINQVDWDIKKMELEGRNATSYSLYMSYVRLKSQYEMQLFRLQQ